MTIAEDKIHRFTIEEYHQMADLGWFDDKRVELLEGQILDMSPQNESHAQTVSRLVRILANNLPDAFEVRCQAPVTATDHSEPEPDFAVIPAPTEPRKGRNHPTTALLVIEVSDTTLARDRRKIVAYAAAAIPEYWIVNLNARTIEQFTHPQPAGADSTYASCQIRSESDTIQCTTLPLPALAVKQCLNAV